MSGTPLRWQPGRSWSPPGRQRGCWSLSSPVSCGEPESLTARHRARDENSTVRTWTGPRRSRVSPAELRAPVAACRAGVLFFCTSAAVRRSMLGRSYSLTSLATHVPVRYPESSRNPSRGNPSSSGGRSSKKSMYCSCSSRRVSSHSLKPEATRPFEPSCFRAARTAR